MSINNASGPAIKLINEDDIKLSPYISQFWMFCYTRLKLHVDPNDTNNLSHKLLFKRGYRNTEEIQLVTRGH